MKKVLPLIIVFISLLYSEYSFSQSSFSHEAGVTFGMASYQTDFGHQNNFPSANAATMAFGITHYLKFFGSQYSWRSGSSFFSTHFKLKTEFTYMNNKIIRHEGDLKDIPKFQQMTGNISMYNIGTNLEFYFFEMEDYSSFYRNENKLNPFLNLGIHYSFYDPNILFNDKDLLIDDNGNYYQLADLKPSWADSESIHLEKDATFGASVGAGIRYSISDVDLVLEGRWQHFFSDKVDGLDDTTPASGSEYNDTMVIVNMGVVYVFGKY